MNYASLFAARIGGSNFGVGEVLYKFEKIKRAKAQAMAQRPDVPMLDFGVGEPDQMAPPAIREALKAAVDDPANRGYADNGIDEFQTAAATYLQRFFGVAGVDPRREINHSIGSKSALTILPLCFINPGDVAIMTVPGYPVLGTHARYLGGDVFNLPLRRENHFLPDLQAIPTDIARRAKIICVNYPNNPTGAIAPPSFFDELIAFARENQILIVQDAAYATVVPPQDRGSILARPGGKDVAIELHSMSKSYNMTGWRLGFVAGAEPAVKAFAAVKDNCDSGQFKAIQLAACKGIADAALAEAITTHYRSRLERMVAVLRRRGFDATMPGGTFFMYVPAPVGGGGKRFATAEEASQYLIREFSISTVPWDEVGAFLRFSATFAARGVEEENRVLAELDARLERAELQFS
jgi:LL-diaminopimelate aminotransferase